MDEPFFFARDDDAHWYMVPERLRDEWEDFIDDPDTVPEGAVMVDNISRITVVVPQKEV